MLKPRSCILLREQSSQHRRKTGEIHSSCFAFAGQNFCFTYRYVCIGMYVRMFVFCLYASMHTFMEERQRRADQIRFVDVCVHMHIRTYIDVDHACTADLCEHTCTKTHAGLLCSMPACYEPLHDLHHMFYHVPRCAAIVCHHDAVRQSC